MPIFTSDLTSRGIIYADTITTNSNEDLTLNPAGTGAVVASARLKVNEISADDSTAVSFKSPVQLDSTLQVAGTLSVVNLTISNGSITDSSGTISFDNENLTTSGTITAGNIQVDNLTVSGTTTSVNSTNITVSDPLLILSETNSGGADVDSGIMIERGSAGNNAALYWNEGDDKFKAVLTTSVGTATSITDSSVATLVANIESSGTSIFGDITVNQIGSNDSSAVSITAPLQATDIQADDIQLSGNIDLTSNGTITIGSGDSTADLTLTHDGTDVYLTKAGTSGEVYVRGRNISLQNDDGTQTFVTAGHGGATELYHGGLVSPGLITTVSGGISIPNGTLLVNTIASGDSASVRINDSIETDGLTVNGTVSINNVQLSEINNTQVDSAVEDIDTWSATTYRAAKYVYRIKNTSTSEYQSGEIMVLHDGTNVQIAEYSLLKTGNNDLITFSVDIDAGNVRLRGSAQATGSDIKLLRTLIED